MKRKLVVLLVVLFIGTMGIASAEYVWPTVRTSRLISSDFGPRTPPRKANGTYGSSYHAGIDIPVGVNNPCYAIEDGEIAFVGHNSSTAGNYIVLSLGSGTTARYLHLNSIDVKVGDKVAKGQVIGKTGNTGGVDAHLHFEIRTGASNPKQSLPGTAQNPLNYYDTKNLLIVGENFTAGNSASSVVNKCPTCNSPLEEKYYSTGAGQHYRACTGSKVHHVITGHEFDKDGKCICEVFKCTFSGCDGIVESKYLIDKPNAVHYKVCSKNPINHHFYVEEHNFLLMGKCVCGEILSGAEGTKTNTNIPVLFNNFAWIQKEVMTLNGSNILPNWENSKLLTVKEFKDGLSAVLKSKNKKVLSENLGLKDSDKITREQAAYIMGAYVEGSLTSDNLLNASDWGIVNPVYKKRINKLVNKKIFKGRENVGERVTADPTGIVTGAEGRVLLNRLYNVL